MPESIDWPRIQSPLRRRRFLLLILAVLAVIFFGGRTALSYYVDVLWFGSLGYRDVLWKTLSLQWGIFTAFAAATFLILFGSFLALKRAHLSDLPSGHTIFIGGQPLKLPVEAVLRLSALGLSLLIAGVTGAGMMMEWPTIALFWNAPGSVGLWQAAELLPVRSAWVATARRLATYAGCDDLRTRRPLHPHHARNACVRRTEQKLRHIALAWPLDHVCVPVTGPCDACVPRSI